MTVNCEICGKQFKNTQGLRGHKTFVHQMTTTHDPVTRLATEQELDQLTTRLEKLESITGLKEPSTLDRLLGTDQPITAQLEEHTRELSELHKQVSELAEQLELSRVAKAMLDAYETDHKRQLEQLRNEWKNAHNSLVGIINRNGELVKNSYSIAEDGAKATNKQVNDLGDHVGHLEERVQSKLALENQLAIRLDAVEGKLSHFEKELSVLRNLTRRAPTGEIVSIELNDKREHHFREYKSKEGLARPYRSKRDLILGDRWIDLSEPED